MMHLKPLVMMQLKDKIDFSFLKSKGKTIAKIIFTILGFAAVVAVCYFLFYLATTLSLFDILPIVPPYVMVVIYSAMFILSCISCSFGLMKTLYMSNDNQVLLTLPVKPNMVFVSKLIVFYLYELLKNIYFVLPVFLAYGIFSGFSWFFYPWLIFCFVIISAIPVLIGALISIPLMFINAWLKQTKVLRLVLYFMLVGVIVYLIVKIISMIPENIDLVANFGSISSSIDSFLTKFSETFVALAYIVTMICGIYNRHTFTWNMFNLDTLWILLSVIAVIVSLFLLVFYISRPLFFKMASSPFEYKKKLIKKTYHNKKNKVLHTSILKEFKTSFRQPDFIYNYLTILIVLPIAILLLNKIFNAMNTRLSGVFMTYSFNILMILLISLASNAIISSIYSKDGRTAYLLKTVPHKHYKYLFPKLIVPLSLTSISMLVTTIILGAYANLSVLNTIFLFLSMIGFYVGHLFWSAELDLMNPQNEQYATTGEVSNNPNEKKSTILAFLISFIVFGVSLFFFMENQTYTWFKLALIGIIFAVARTYFYFTKIKVYYGEK